MITIRAWSEHDCVTQLTDLLHRAYAPLAAAGMRFLATHQDDATTLRRMSKGPCFVAERQGTIVGTICYTPPGRTAGCEWYRLPHVASFGQFAVEPALQGTGVGSILLQRVEDQAMNDGARELTLDTSEHAQHLIDYYTRRGYRFVQHVQWDCVNYRSVILSKSLLIPDAGCRGREPGAEV